MMKCTSLKKYGHDSCADAPHFVGGFAEYCYITPGTCVIKLPDELSDEEVAPANCALATVIAATEAIGLQPFENILIQGAGALGFYAAALAKHYGCRRIVVTDILDHRLEMVRRFGATDTLNTKDMKEEEIVAAVKNLTGGFGVDCALEVAGLPGLIPLGLRCLRTGGRYMETGSAWAGANFTCDASELIFRCLTLKGFHNYDTKHLQSAVDFLRMTHKIFPFREMVGEEVTLDNINEGLRLAESGKTIRVAVKP